MANYRKSFNLRNGVQIDDDNFIVNANGLVGIGTSIPTEFLDVRGNVKVSGLTTTNSLYAGIATFNSLRVSSDASISGVVTATSFSGSASGLTGVYAIAVDGWHINSGTISTTSSVGIGTTIPSGLLQIGNNIVFDLNGGASYSGIITASSFNGSFNGPLNGSLNASNLTGIASNSILPSNINVSGIVTASLFNGNLVGIASTARFLIGTPDITVGFVTATRIQGDSLSVGILTATNGLNVGTSGSIFTISSGNIGIGSAIPNEKLTLLGGNIGIRSTTNAPYTILGERIGVGTFIPSSDIQIRRSSNASLLVTSDNSQSIIALGRSTTTSSNVGALRYGNSSPLFPYSTQNSLDIINYGSGNVNFYIEGGDVGVGTGSFYWLRRGNFTQLMTLTYDGNLGIGITIPRNKLHVVGTSTVTNDAYFGNNVEINNDLTVYNNCSIQGTLTLTNSLISDLTGNVIGNIQGDVYSVGISTFNTISVTTSALVGSVGISTDNNENYPLNINKSFIVDNTGNLGVGTDTVRSSVDFGDAGKVDSPTKAFMIAPRLTTTQRAGLSTEPGAIIYNVTTNKHQGFNGTSWFDLY
jgi:hypothetical protein